ncbi:MAG: universal stress protein [Candidatus Binataceae bacterium]|jgi:nucleotide-binding universal stress UspA family protein
MSNETDRYGDKLRQVEKAREDQWAAEKDRELLARLRQQSEERTATERQQGKTSKLFNRILCPIDFDENSLKALDIARRLASQNDAELYLLHVCATVFVPLGGPVTDRVMAEQSAQRRMEEITGQNLFNIRCQLLVTTGDAGQWITAVQSALDADLIVMGTHGRRAVPRFFLGSVAERVVREAECPVLTIREHNHE